MNKNSKQPVIRDFATQQDYFDYLDNVQKNRTHQAQQPIGKYSVRKAITIAKLLGARNNKQIVKDAKHILQLVIEKRQVANACALIDEQLKKK